MKEKRIAPIRLTRENELMLLNTFDRIDIAKEANKLIAESSYNALRREQSFKECKKVKERNESLTRTVESQQLTIERLTTGSYIEEWT